LLLVLKDIYKKYYVFKVKENFV